MKFPSIPQVTKELIDLKKCLLKGSYFDVRLQVLNDGTWVVRYGSSDYDYDHRGYWGASSIDKKTNCRELAKDLIEQVKDSCYHSDKH